MKFSALPILFSVTLLVGCASTPDWSGMSEDKIAAWRGMGLTAEVAQEFADAGISSSEVTQWREAGLSATDAIIAWNEAGWNPETAGPWIERKFSLEAATAWAEEKFTAEQARTWFDAGFDLREAISNRDKGLTPVR